MVMTPEFFRAVRDGAEALLNSSRALAMSEMAKAGGPNENILLQAAEEKLQQADLLNGWLKRHDPANLNHR